MLTIRRATPIFWLTFLTFITGVFPVAIAALCMVEFGPALLVPTVLLGALWGYLLVRAVRVRFVAADAGIVIANLFRSHHFAWSEIASLTTGLGTKGLQMGGGRVEVHVVLKSGAVVMATATDSATERFEELVRDLLPVMELATAHAVPTEWKNLSELDTLIVERLLRATSALTSFARTVGRAG